MSSWQVVVHHKPGVTDHRGEGIRKECAHAGLKGVKKVRVGQAYELSGTLSDADVRRMAEALLTDPITQEAVIASPDDIRAPKGARLGEVWPKNGVSDPVADTVRLAAADLGIQGLATVRSGQSYEFFGGASPEALRRFCEEHLMNALIQKVDVL